jgi:flavin reductase (DIM6/NTAB) family NADH-FMN oxidoreductase RutF
MSVARDEFRAFFGSFPTAVSIVTTVDTDGAPRGFTCSAVTSVSMDPPLLLVCLDRSARSLAPLLSAGAFVVNVLADGAEDTARAFASRSERKFTGVRWQPSARAKGAPVLSDLVVGYAECTVTRSLQAGDHWIVIGRVEGVAVFPRPPVLHQRGVFGVWPGELAASRG